MFYACVRRFDVINIVGNFLKTKQGLNQTGHPSAEELRAVAVGRAGKQGHINASIHTDT